MKTATRTLTCIALLASALTGCAQYQWQKPGATLAGFNQDMGECNQQAYALLPVQMVTRKISDAYRVPASKKCTTKDNTTNCETIAAHWVPAQYVTEDVNEDGRNTQVKSCIYARGYQEVKVEDNLVDKLTGNLTAAPRMY